VTTKDEHGYSRQEPESSKPVEAFMRTPSRPSNIRFHFSTNTIVKHQKLATLSAKKPRRNGKIRMIGAVVVARGEKGGRKGAKRSTPVFVLVWLWSLKCSVEVSWAMSGLPGKRGKMKGRVSESTPVTPLKLTFGRSPTSTVETVRGEGKCVRSALGMRVGAV
jgi:hypothetical protein